MTKPKKNSHNERDLHDDGCDGGSPSGAAGGSPKPGKRGRPAGSTSLDYSQLCAAMNRQGKPCGNPVVLGSDYCVVHEDFVPPLPTSIQLPGDTPAPKKKIPAIPKSSWNQVEPEYRPGFKQQWERLFTTFDLNDSSDQLSVDIVCLYTVSLKKARIDGDMEMQKFAEQTIRHHMNMLKASRITRENPTVNVNHLGSPAEWAAELIRDGATMKPGDLHRMTTDALPVGAVDAEYEDIDEEGKRDADGG